MVHRARSTASFNSSLPDELTPESVAESLLHLTSRVEEVLSLQRKVDRNVSKLVHDKQSVAFTQSIAQAARQSTAEEPTANFDDAIWASPGIEQSRTVVVQDIAASAPLRPCWSSLSLGSAGTSTVTTADGKGTGSRHGVFLGCTSSSVRTSSMTRSFDMMKFLTNYCEVDQEGLDEELDRLLGDLPARVAVATSYASQASQLGFFRTTGYILDPHCEVRIAWDLLSVVVLALDVIGAPIVLAWNLKVEEVPVLMFFAILCVIFWSTDMVLNFFTGYYREGDLETKPTRVAKQYLKGWFLPDVVILGSDLATFAIGGERGAGSGILRMSKATRFLRLVRLFRLARISDSLARLMDANVYLEITVETLKPLLAIVMITHLLACSWWSTSRYLPSDTGLRWINQALVPGTEMSYIDTDFSNQYLTCVHWSLTQLTVGSMDIAPVNSFERAFNCLSLMLGMLVFSSLISSISAKMIQHYLKQKDKLTKCAALRRFLRHRVRPRFVIAAQFQARKAMFGSTGKPVTYDEVDAIAMLPQALQRTIQVELIERHLRHPLLRWWFVIDNKGAQALCHSAIDFIGLAAEDNLFFPRTKAVGAYVLTIGEALYTEEYELIQGKEGTEVCEGTFFVEVALWCQWKHHGELMATKGCELLLIRTAGLIKCLEEEDGMVNHVVVQYGRTFFARVMSLDQQGCEQAGDLAVPFTAFDSILPSMPMECRQLVGAVAVCVSRENSRHSRREPLDASSKEVRHGRCCLMVNWEGEVQRIVSIIVLRLSREDDKVLARVGVWNEEGMHASCELPGKKQREGESTARTFERLWQGAFAPLAQHINCSSIELQETWKESKRLQIKTKYLKTVTHADLTCPVEHLGLEETRLRLAAGKRWSYTPGANPNLSTQSVEWRSERRSSRGSLGLSRDVDEDQFPIYALADEVGEITLVSWLTKAELRYFASPAGEACLQSMMESVVISSETVQVAKARYAISQAKINEQDLGLDVSRASV